jgi:PAS domain S-box-containing protein
LPDGAAGARQEETGELLDRLPCGVISFDDRGTIVAVNATLARMLGYDRAELIGRGVESLLTVAGRIFFQTHLFPLVRLHGRAEELFVLFRRKDGSDVGTLLNAARLEVDGSAVTDCAVMEVRERRKFEDALVRAKQAAEAANAALQERTREVEHANELLEQQTVELELQQQQLQDSTAELEAQSEEMARINDELVARSHDLEQARNVAEEANQAKSQFLAVMSHELRTPLNAIGGYAQLIDLGVHGPVTEGQREALDRIMRSQRHLLSLINEVLNLARIESGHIEYATEDFALADAVSAVMPMVEPQIAAAGLTSDSSVAPDILVRADREKAQQILINLLTNALKFTPAGGRIVVTARRDGEGHVVLDITDSGIGIPADKLDSVFAPFVQVDVGHTRKREGSGLGLAISRDLARGMGGDLRARSELGRGSTFSLVLPGA